MNSIYLIFHRTIFNANNITTNVMTLFPEKWFNTKSDADYYLEENGWKKNNNDILGEHYISAGRVAIIKEVNQYE